MPYPQQAPVPMGADSPQGPGWYQATDGRWYPPQIVEAPKKPVYKRVWFWLLVVFALGIGGCVTIVTTAGVAINKAATANHTVFYSVTGDGTADVTYDSFTNGNSGTSQVTGATLPWTKTETGSGLFNIYSLAATVSTGSSVTCTITVDGKQISTHTSTGQFANVDCTGTAP